MRTMHYKTRSISTFVSKVMAQTPRSNKLYCCVLTTNLVISPQTTPNGFCQFNEIIQDENSVMM